MNDIKKLNNGEIIIIRELYFELMISGEKQWEFRKLSKGIESGEKIFVTNGSRYYCEICKTHTWDKIIGICVCGHNKKEQADNNYVLYDNGVILGSGNIEPKMVNPLIYHDGFGYRMTMFTNREDRPIREVSIDKPSYDFVKNNYLSENVHDFIAYKISDVERWK